MELNEVREQAYGRYRNFTAPDYSQLATSYERRVGRFLGDLKGKRCLDLACGFGNFLAFLSTQNVSEYIGVDSSDPAIGAVRAQFGAEHGHCCDIFSYMRSSDERFQLISALDFVEHLTKPELYEFLEAVSRRLSDDGQFLVRVPNAAGIFGMASRYNDITHEICFTPNSIRDVFSSRGLDAIAVWEDTGTPRSLMQLAHRGLWEAVRLGIRMVDAAETGVWGEGVLTRNMWALAKKSSLR